MKKAFTLIEVVIVIAIIAIIAAVLMPMFVSGKENATDKIVDIYNGQAVKVIDYDTGEVLYEGTKNELTGYTLIDVKYENGVVIMYVRRTLCR